MRRGFAAFSRGDWEGVMADVDPEIEWHVAFRLPDLPPGKEVWHGHGEVKELFAAFRAAWDKLTIELEEVLYEGQDPEGLDLVISRVRFNGRGGGSGIEVDRRLFYVQRLRDGRLFRQVPYDSEEAAFAAAGVDRE